MPTSINSFDKHKQKAALRQVLLFRFEFFEQATENSITKFREKLKQHERALKELSDGIPDVDENNYHNITEEEWKLIDEYTDLHTNIEFTKEHLLSLMEMKVVYLFKSLEVIMKRIIQIAYPKTNARDLYQWDNMKAFFKSNDIDIIKLEGYDECIELRKVNNTIKHNGIINGDIKHIAEFSNETEFDFDNLDVFYKRVRSKVERFSEVLKDKVEENLFEFPMQRLTNMADEFYRRMDEVAFSAFVEKLSEKLPPNQTRQVSYGFDDLPF